MKSSSCRVYSVLRWECEVRSTRSYGAGHTADDHEWTANDTFLSHRRGRVIDGEWTETFESYALVVEARESILERIRGKLFGAKSR